MEACVGEPMRDASELESGSHLAFQIVSLSVSAEVTPTTISATTYLLAVELVALSRARNTELRI